MTGLKQVSRPLSFENCEDEPIRIPGSVQQHGFFLLADAEAETVLAASENAARFLDQPLPAILGARLADLLHLSILDALTVMQGAQLPGQTGQLTYLGAFHFGDSRFSATTHRIGTFRALEFELQPESVGVEAMNAIITNYVSNISRLGSESELCDALALQVADLTGFDRILLYSFNEEGHGTVLSEVNNGRLPSYLGLRFPASDIPRQARELYVLNTVRIIPDAGYIPSPLRAQAGMEVATLDLSLSPLRSVSPIHLEYMRNMGTAASMSISIVVNGRLWGLVSCHHAEPKVVPYLFRSACDMLTRIAGTQITSFQNTARLRQMLRFNAVQRGLLTTLAAEQQYLEGLIPEFQNVLQVTDADGVAMLLDGTASSHGEVPDEASLLRLADWLDGRPDFDVYATDHLSAELPWTEDIRETASGLLAVRIASVQRRYILWFRSEVIKTVRWAGEPGKTKELADHLSPRHSFNSWQETVRGRSLPWSEMETESARDFRTALTTIGLRRAEEAAEISDARFNRLAQALPVKVFGLNDEGEVTFVNARWRNTGLRTSGLWYEDPLIHPGDVEHCARDWKLAVAAGEAFECELRLRSGTDAGRHASASHAERWFHVRIAPFQRAGAARAGWIGTFVDLTESKERELALRMSEKLALTGRMTSVIAHEINNPLEAITNLMYLLRTEMPADGPAASYIGMVESELERISGITKQTLRWNREVSDVHEGFELGSMVDDVLRLFAGKIRNRQLTVRTTGDGTLRMHGVLGQIRQVLTNLVSNAIDASPINGAMVIGLASREGGIGFFVTDKGGGIDPATLSRLFEPFHSTKGDLGNGLGLYISKEIVERHGGSVIVDTEVGRGTTMSIWLPA